MSLPAAPLLHLPHSLPVTLRSLMLKLSEPLLFYFSFLELFQEIDAYAKQCSKEHNAERIWEWVLKTKVGRRPCANS